MTKDLKIRWVLCFLAAGYAPAKAIHMLLPYLRSFDTYILETFIFTPGFIGFIVGGILVAIGISKNSMWAWWIGFFVALHQLNMRIEILYGDYLSGERFIFFPLGFVTLWLLVFLVLLLHPSIRSDLKGIEAISKTA